ncbi:MAG TPA: carboxynorspermidine decarboxylase, partial [Spirochaetota bacterium]
MERDNILKLDLKGIKTPCFIVDTSLIERNAQVLKSVKDATGCKILLAQKGFAMFALYPILRRYLDGTCASSPHEARLGR